RFPFEVTGWTVLFGLAVFLSALYAYYSIFTRFQAYDDEGFVLISLKEFFRGKALYDEVYSCYQPGFYVFHWLLFGLAGVPLCHDSIRFFTLVLWLAGAFLNGLITWRLSSNLFFALLVFVLSVRCLDAFANEPGHPQALAYALVAALIACFGFADAIPTKLIAPVIGGLLGLLLMVKINVGAFAAAPTALILASSGKGSFAFWRKAAIGLLMIGSPIFLMHSRLTAKVSPPWNLFFLGAL